MQNYKSTFTIILGLLIFFSLDLSGQNRSRTNKSRSSKGKTQIMYTAHVGLFYELGSIPTESFSYDTNLFKASKFGIGQIRFQNKQASQFLLELSGYSTDLGVTYRETLNGPRLIRGINYNTILVEFEYFRSLLKTTEFANKLHAGVTLNTSFMRDEIVPYSINQFPIRENCFCVGLGLKAMYPLNIFGATMLLSTGVNLIDLGIDFRFNGNPNIFADQQNTIGFEAGFLRPRVGLNIGFVFK